MPLGRGLLLMMILGIVGVILLIIGLVQKKNVMWISGIVLIVLGILIRILMRAA